MKNFLVLILLLFLYSTLSAQDKSQDGRVFEQFPSSKLQLPGFCNCDVLKHPSYSFNNIKQPDNNNDVNLSFSLFWSSPSNAFSNSNDGWAGYLDNDTLLDIVGYTFNPSVLYIREQTPNNPDSFDVVYSYTKQENGSFGPVTVGDIDGDGKPDIVLSDYSTLSRIYVISNTGNNTYVSRETQNTLTNPADGSSVQNLLIGDLNKNGQKEIIITRGNSSPTAGTVRFWEHTGSPGTFSFTNLYTYTTVSYLFGKGGIGDSDGDGWDEVFLTYGGYDLFNTNIRKIKFDSASNTFVHQIFTANALGFPSNYKVADLYGNGQKELIASQSSNGRAAVYIYKSTGVNVYQTVDSLFETSDNNTMMTCDVRTLTGDTHPAIIAASFGGNIYGYQYTGSSYSKQYQNLTGLGSAFRRIYWLPWTGYDGFFSVWMGSSSTFFIYKRDDLIGINHNETIANSFSLEQNYPNPFNPSTTIKYSIPFNGYVIINIYDLNGKLIDNLVNGTQTKGIHYASFSGVDYATGIYFYKIVYENKVVTRKMILLK